MSSLIALQRSRGTNDDLNGDVINNGSPMDDVDLGDLGMGQQLDFVQTYRHGSMDTQAAKEEIVPLHPALY